MKATASERSAPARAVIEVTGVTKAYGEADALREATLELGRGEKALLLGSNGEGKSTLLRVMAGLTTPDAGSVRVDGREPDGERVDVARRLGYAGHALFVYGDLTAEENLRFTAGLYGVRDAAGRSDECLAMVGLREQRYVRARALSQGQLRRLAVARAVVHDPPVLLLDEPFAALDASARRDLADWLAGDGERTTLVATHQLDLAPECVDRGWRLDGGHVLEVGGGRAKGLERSGRVSSAWIALGRAPGALEVVRLLVGKDLRIEWRSRLRFQSLLLFAAALAFVVSYGFRLPAAVEAALPAGIWTLTVFLQLFFLSHAYRAEMENGCHEALLLAPVSRSSVALAKTLVGVLLAAAPTLLALGMLALLSGSARPLSPAALLPLALETVGVVAAGTLVFATTTAGEEPALDLHALVLLAVAPLLVLGQEVTQRAFGGAALGALAPLLLLLAGYAAALVAVAALAHGAFATEPQRRRPDPYPRSVESSSPTAPAPSTIQRIARRFFQAKSR